MGPESNLSICGDGNQTGWREASIWTSRIGHPLVLYIGLFGNGLSLGALWRSAISPSQAEKITLRCMLIIHSLYLLIGCSTESFLSISNQVYDLRLLLDCNTYELFRGALKLLCSWMIFILLLKKWSLLTGRGHRYINVGKCMGVAVFMALVLNWHCFGGLATDKHDIPVSERCYGIVREIDVYYRDINPWIQMVLSNYLPILLSVPMIVGTWKRVKARDADEDQVIYNKEGESEKERESQPGSLQIDENESQGETVDRLVPTWKRSLEFIEELSQKSPDIDGQAPIYSAPDAESPVQEQEVPEEPAASVLKPGVRGRLADIVHGSKLQQDSDSMCPELGSMAQLPVSETGSALSERARDLDSDDEPLPSYPPAPDGPADNHQETTGEPPSRFVTKAEVLQQEPGNEAQFNNSNNDGLGDEENSAQDDQTACEASAAIDTTKTGENDRPGPNLHNQASGTTSSSPDINKKANYYESPYYKVQQWKASSDTFSCSSQNMSVDSDMVIDTMNRIWQDTYQAKKAGAAFRAKVKGRKAQATINRETESFRKIVRDNSQRSSGRLHSRQSTLRLKGKQGWDGRRKRNPRSAYLALIIAVSFIVLNIPHGISFIVFQALETNGQQPDCVWHFADQLCVLLQYACFAFNAIYFFISIEVSDSHFHFDCLFCNKK